MPTTLAPVALILATASLSRSPFQSPMTRLAPSCAKRVAIANPIPDAAPVTITTLSAKRIDVLLLLMSFLVVNGWRGMLARGWAQFITRGLPIAVAPTQVHKASPRAAQYALPALDHRHLARR